MRPANPVQVSLQSCDRSLDRLLPAHFGDSPRSVAEGASCPGGDRIWPLPGTSRNDAVPIATAPTTLVVLNKWHLSTCLRFRSGYWSPDERTVPVRCAIPDACPGISQSSPEEDADARCVCVLLVEFRGVELDCPSFVGSLRSSSNYACVCAPAFCAHSGGNGGGSSGGRSTSGCSELYAGPLCSSCSAIAFQVIAAFFVKKSPSVLGPVQ